MIMCPKQSKVSLSAWRDGRLEKGHRAGLRKCNSFTLVCCSAYSSLVWWRCCCLVSYILVSMSWGFFSLSRADKAKCVVSPIYVLSYWSFILFLCVRYFNLWDCQERRKIFNIILLLIKLKLSFPLHLTILRNFEPLTLSLLNIDK